MITRNLIKDEIDRVQEKHLEVLYRIVKALETPPYSDELSPNTTSPNTNWKEFIEATYGSLAASPIKRGEQGQYKERPLDRMT